MEAPYRAVTVISCIGAVLGQDLTKASNERGELRWINRGVLNEGDRFPLAFHPEQKAEPSLSELPDALLLDRIVGEC